MGVKSLWTLLAPVGRPILLETVEGKAMAIDSSIWIYQFQATMRDKEGRALLNAHVLGFLRRISKLLFYGIKPVFVFDGGAPALKRSTLNERKKKKSGAALSHIKIAERLLAAQMRKEALNHAQSKKPSKGKGRERTGPPGDTALHENTVYLEDIDSSMPKTHAKPKPTTPSSSPKKNKYHDHDPYRLPEVDLDEVVSKATRATAPDPRLATEDELRAFIEEMQPEDFNITSPEFRELPTEVQYEIIGDMRLRSRQTSHARLLKMLRMAPTPMDFSKQQIINLKERNNLTQQLLATTDSIGNAHLAIPVRIASERNRQYVLTKNEGAEGGWVLAIQDKRGAGPDNPIMIDVEEAKGEGNDADEDADMEEVDTTNVADPDLRQYQREMALSAIAGRRSPKKAAPMSAKPISRKNAKPLFDFDEDDEEAEIMRQAMQQVEDEEDEELALAIQESLDQAKKSQPEGGLLLTPFKKSPPKHAMGSPVAASSSNTRRPPPEVDVFTPSGLETALAFAGTGTSRNAVGRSVSGSGDKSKSAFGTPALLSSPGKFPMSAHPAAQVGGHILWRQPTRPLEEVPSPTAAPVPVISGLQALTDSEEDDEMEEVNVPTPTFTVEKQTDLRENNPTTSVATTQLQNESESEDEDMEEVQVDLPDSLPTREATRLGTPPTPNTPRDPSPISPAAESIDAPSISPPPMPDKHNETPLFTWSRSPSPSHQPERADLGEPTLMTDIISHEPGPAGEQTNTENEQTGEEHWDAANEIDPYAEEGEFVKFLSQVKGRDLDDVRKEIDDEIKVLNEQRKAAMRDSEDITQQMISQIMTMLRLFGMPYITAPMEAEAQCAELVSLGLVDGVITDDSDVFLFGSQRVYKNMFNQSKTVEVFLLSDLERELGLDRDTLIRLAYLLGSDYTEGLKGAGPVVAMELLKEFPGKDGLHKFADWWRRVQEGKDKESESNTKIRRQFKKKFKDLYIPADWPNPAVRDAYYHPTVDSSEEPFKWGLPDLDGLRAFFQQELGWGQTKVDELLLPIIRKMNKRYTSASGTSSGMQGSLSDWVSTHAGNNLAGNMAPRRKEVYTSHRLQQVVADFRKRRKNGSVGPSRSRSGSGEENNASEGEDESVRKRQRKAKSGPPRVQGGRGRGRGKSKRGGGATRSQKGKAKDDEDYNEDEKSSDVIQDNPDPTQIIEARPRIRPRPVRRGPNVEADISDVMDSVE